MDDLSDAVLICGSADGGSIDGSYQVIRNPPAPWIGGRAFPALPAVANNWQVNTNYAAAAQVNSQQAVFGALVGGLSAAGGSGPSGQGQAIPDGTGTLVWAFLGPLQQQLTAFGSVQPLTGAELDRLPEEYRTREVRAFWTNTLLRTSGPDGEADIVVANGFKWQVTPMQQWENLGNYRKVLLVRVGR